MTETENADKARRYGCVFFADETVEGVYCYVGNNSAEAITQRLDNLKGSDDDDKD